PQPCAGVQSMPVHPKNTTLRICLLAGALGLLLVLGLGWGLEKRRRRAHEAWANQTVAASLRAAQEHLAHRQWDKAIDALQTALATEGVTDFRNAQELLLLGQKAQADALWEAARSAVLQKNAPRAMELLQEYLAHPQAAHKDPATRLHLELAWAT